MVAAPFGLTLGGGCEICLNADAVQAHAETYIGLVETGVGVIPAWTGSTELVTRWVQNKRRPGGPVPPLAQAFETIGMAKVAKSAFEAKDLLFLREGDGITMNRDRLLADAKAKALALAEGTGRPRRSRSRCRDKRPARRCGSSSTACASRALPRRMTRWSPISSPWCSRAATPTSPTVSEDDLLARATGVHDLIKHPATLARLEHMLETGKPLRN